MPNVRQRQPFQTMSPSAGSERLIAGAGGLVSVDSVKVVPYTRLGLIQVFGTNETSTVFLFGEYTG